MNIGYHAAIDAVAETPIGSGRAPAPGALRLVQAFLNTFDVEADEDRLGSPAGAESWLRERGLLESGATLDAQGQVRLVAFRERLRDTIDARDGAGDTHVPLTDPLAAPVLVTLDPSAGVHLGPAGTGVDGVVGRVLSAVVSATADGTWPRLRICRNHACRWSFYDASRNRSAHWCSMATCGNRMKGRAFRRRRGAGTV